MVRSILIVTILAAASASDAAVLTSARAHTLQRFKRQCEDGIGKACYDYGRALWSTPGAVDRKSSRKFLLRSCTLRYQPACTALQEHSAFTTPPPPKKSLAKSGPVESGGACFNNQELANAKLKPNSVSPTSVHGQRIYDIKPGSFWSRVGLQEDDVIYKLNNMPFNFPQEVLQAFGSTGKKFAFEVERYGQTMTLWYTCQ